MIAALLFVPEEPHRAALVGEGVCGARPPVVPCGAGRVLPWLRHQADDAKVGPVRESLVLAWNGVAVPEGMDRAARVLAAREGLEPGSTAPAWLQEQEDGSAWALSVQDGTIFYVPPTWPEREFCRHVEALTRRPAGLSRDLWAAWAMAVACETRGLGRVVLVRSNKEG